MKNKIHRVKQFVNNHNDAFYWTCGLITGASAVFVTMHQSSSMNTILSMTADQAKALASDPSNCMTYEFGKDTVLVVIKD